jgi:tetratricopeptide (TPR) repeat protein
LRAALALAPDDRALLGELVRELAAAGQGAAAIADVARLVDAHPARDAGRVELLLLRADLKRTASAAFDALTDVEEAYTIAGASVLSELLSTLALARDAARDTGSDAAARATSLRLVELLETQGEHEQARAELAALSESLHEDVEILLALRERDQRAERWDEVARSSERLIPLSEGDARVAAVLTLADAYEQLGHGISALPWLVRVHEEAPAAWALRDRLRLSFTQLGQQRELAQLLVGDAEYHIETADKLACWQQAAALFLALGDPEAATEPLQKAMTLAPDDDATRVSLIDLDLALGRADAAAASIEQAFQVHKRRSPELARFQLRMARVCAQRGDTQAQLKWLNTALDTDRKSGEVASELVDAALAVTDYDTAMKALRTLTMMEDPQPITRALAFLKQAEIAHLRGDSQRALHWARKAKSLDESLHAADELLARLEG